MMPVIRRSRSLDGRVTYKVKTCRRGTWQRCDKWWAEVAMKNRMAKLEQRKQAREGN